MRGELVLARRPSATAEASACVRRAIDAARRRHARALELRAAMSLRRVELREREGRAAEESLAEVYAWFTEGFETMDLRDARRLLDALT